MSRASKRKKTATEADADIEVVSKTERKREAERLQALGRRLSELSREQRDSLPLTDALRVAIDDYLRFPSREARRRQLQFVGKVMRSTDCDAIEAALENLEGESAQARYAFAQAEHWRERLLEDGSKLAEFIDTYPHTDRQQLRHLIKKAQTTLGSEHEKQHARALFRALREVIDEAAE